MRFRESVGLFLIGVAWLASPAYAENDTIKLESIFVGDKEQPPVSYFIPWQEVGMSNKLYRSIEGRLDNTLAPVDRDVLIRSIRVYREMNVEGN